MTDELDVLMRGRRFIYICGAEGSGTTMLTKIVSAPAQCSSLGGNWFKLPAFPDAVRLAQEFEQADRQLSDQSRTFAEHGQAVARYRASLLLILQSPCFAAQTHLFFKRSFPYANSPYPYPSTPDLCDTDDVVPNAHYIAIYREPRAACFSALRRGFDTNLRRLAISCSANLTWLAAQLHALDPSRTRVVSYEALCKEPARIISSLAQFCGLAPESLSDAAAVEKINPNTNQRFQSDLDPQTLSWLDRFFDARKRRQWALLEESAET